MRSDSDIVDAFRAGNEDSFRAIVTVLNLGHTRLARTSVTQAIVQDVDLWDHAEQGPHLTERVRCSQTSTS